MMPKPMNEPTTKEEFDRDSRYNGQPTAESKRLREQFYPPVLDAEQLEGLEMEIEDAGEGETPSYDDEAVRIAVIELLRLRTQVANLKVQVAAWQRHDNDVAGNFCPQPHRMMSDDR